MQDDTQKKTAYLVKILGEIVKSFRESQGKTIYKISAEAGVPKATWREIELGLKNFRFSTLWNVADGLEVPLSKIMAELEARVGSDFSLSDLD